MLTITENEIRRNGPGNALGVCWRQWRTERILFRRGICFRETNPDQIAAAYAAMTENEFHAINARQDWANWRTIPRALSGQVPDRPLRVLDLGCGAGSSTQVLAFYCPAGSQIIGYELVPSLVEVAQRRGYYDRRGLAVAVDFVSQEVTRPFRLPDGGLVPPASIDLVNSSGVVGHHLNPQTIGPLVEELKRVLAPGSTAILDAGPSLLEKSLISILALNGFAHFGRRRSWFLDPTAQVVFHFQTS